MSNLITKSGIFSSKVKKYLNILFMNFLILFYFYSSLNLFQNLKRYVKSAMLDYKEGIN
jgi:hypothetical protein